MPRPHESFQRRRARVVDGFRLDRMGVSYGTAVEDDAILVMSSLDWDRVLAAGAVVPLDAAPQVG